MTVVTGIISDVSSPATLRRASPRSTASAIWVA
jgi:hypothetical protein